MCHFFINLEKLYFVPILSAFGLKTPRALTILKPQTTTFLKKTWLYHFLSYIKPTPFKRSEILISKFREKPQANKRINRQTYGAYFIEPSLHVSHNKLVAAELNHYFTKIVNSLNLHEFALDLAESIFIRLTILFQNPKLTAAL